MKPADTFAMLTLRRKGVLAFALLLGYFVVIGLIVAQERHKLLRIQSEIARLNIQDQMLIRARTALGHSVFRLQKTFYADDPLPAIDEIALDMEVVQSGVRELVEHLPQIAQHLERLNRNIAELRAAPSRANLIGLRENQEELAGQLNEIRQRLDEQGKKLSDDYRVVNDTITLIILIMGLLGVVAFGAMVTLFFNRLAWDIKKLEARAVDVVSGYRGAPLEVTRHDEVGGLMAAVNRMQSELRQREQQLEISRQQRFHQEKMAAIGSLAAEIAHEINNPIAAISGIAHSMGEVKRSCGCQAATGCQPELILEHTERIASITRQVAQLTIPHSQEPDLVDLNAVMRSTCGFIRYDKRFHGIDLALELDHDLPAVETVADHVTQVLMNLLINAADALEGVSDRKPAIRVTTRAGAGEVVMMVSDNGCGMDRTLLSKAFDESFTTKPPGKGRGLGLFLCKSLIEEGGGRIEMESTPGVGTTARVHLPLQYQHRLAA